MQKKGEFKLTLGDGRERVFRITPAAAGRFERAANKNFGAFDAQSVNDLAMLLEACDPEADTFEALFDPMRFRLDKMRLFGRMQPALLELLPLEEKGLLRVQFVVTRALAEVRGKPLPVELVELVRAELGALPGEEAPSFAAGAVIAPVVNAEPAVTPETAGPAGQGDTGATQAPEAARVAAEDSAEVAAAPGAGPAGGRVLAGSVSDRAD